MNGNIAQTVSKGNKQTRKYTKRNTEFWKNPRKKGANLNNEWAKGIVELYDSSLIYSYNTVARIMRITPQRVGQIHKSFPHDCPRKKLKEANHE